MKLLIITLIFIITWTQLFAKQDTTEIRTYCKNLISVVDNDTLQQVRIGDNGNIEVKTDSWGDTTHIRIGQRTFKVIENKTGTHLELKKEKNNDRRDGFINPHWSGLEFGMNFYGKTDYSIYEGINTNTPEEFMELHNAKSITVNLNLAEWAYVNNANNIAFVTGIGFSFMDLAFEHPITISKQNDNNIILPANLSPERLKKSKLNITYLTVPLMLEIKTPLHLSNKHIQIGGGVIGGLNLGSHTKYKYKKNKEKNRSNFNLNTLKCDLTGRIGLGSCCFFINYSLTPLFKENKGPELYPMTIGFSLINF